jgi:nucleoside-triphosphatase
LASKGYFLKEDTRTPYFQKLKAPIKGKTFADSFSSEIMKAYEYIASFCGMSKLVDTKFLLTGVPGSGKSTVMLHCVERLHEMGFTVGGIATPEVRRGGRRVGFSVLDLASGRRAALAEVGFSSEFTLGRYGVNIAEFESVALPALDYAEMRSDVICIDEIGRMELFSNSFKLKIEHLLRSQKPTIAVLHREYVSTYGRGGILLRVSPKNREKLVELIVRRIAKS